MFRQTNNTRSRGKVLIPAGQQGIAKVTHFDISERESRYTAIRDMQHPGSFIPVGRYARLHVKNTLMMSDTVMERSTNVKFVARAHGRVLVGGLGLGLILFPLVDNPKVMHITVVEKYQDVIDLVGPALKAKFGDRLEIICADIFDWKPPKGSKWNVIYHDIWPTICTDNLVSMVKLHRKYGRYLDRDDPKRWMDSWMRSDLLRLKRQGD